MGDSCRVSALAATRRRAAHASSCASCTSPFTISTRPRTRTVISASISISVTVFAIDLKTSRVFVFVESYLVMATHFIEKPIAGTSAGIFPVIEFLIVFHTARDKKDHAETEKDDAESSKEVFHISIIRQMPNHPARFHLARRRCFCQCKCSPRAQIAREWHVPPP